jgi:hypothetical protein
LWHGLNSLPETWLFWLFVKVALLTCENGCFSFFPKHALDNYSILSHICSKNYYFATSENLFSSLFSLIVFLQNLECSIRTFFLIYITLFINFYLFRLDNFGPVNLNTFIIVIPETHSKLFVFIVTFRNTVFRSQLKPWILYLLHFLGLHGILS